MSSGIMYLRTSSVYTAVAVVGLLLGAGGVAGATVREVPGTYATIQAAINASSNGDEVVIAPGAYHERINFNGRLITVRSASGNPADTIIDGDAGGSVVTFNHSETSAAVLSGLTITNGRATDGGGVLCLNAAPTITGNVITANLATGTYPYGGGVYVWTGHPAHQPVITDNTITNNSASGSDSAFGSGVYALSYGSPTLSGNLIAGNTASTPSGQYAYGGGVFCEGEGSFTISNNRLTGNTAWIGGGLCLNMGGSGATTVSGNILAANTATVVGGGAHLLHHAPATTLVTGNTLWGNAGGGIRCEFAPGGGVTIVNTIVAGSTSGTGITTIGGGPPIIYCNVFGNAGGQYNGCSPGAGCISADPLFVDAAAGDFHLQSRAGHWTPGGWVIDAAHSPCVDAGQPASAYANEPAPNGGRVNMGAYGNTAQASKGSVAAIIAETGVPYDFIQPAIDAAAAGQNVVVQPGTWHERINFNGKHVIVRSNNPDDPAVVAGTVLDGDAGGSVVTLNNQEPEGAALKGLTITNGRAANGGGIICETSTVEIRGNVITGNAATGNGGGLYLKSANGLIEGNLVTHNQAAGNGGGLFCSDMSLPLRNCTVYGNTAVQGGGVYWTGIYQVIRNCIISGNTAMTGGGVYFNHGPQPPPMRCNDVWGNTGGEYGNMPDPTGTDGNLSVDPLFADARQQRRGRNGAGDFHLQSKVGRWTAGGWVTDAAHSPCIDAGFLSMAFGNEPEPNGNRLNMGFEGNTPHASKSVYAARVVEGDVRCGTVQTAIERATPGQTVEVQPGTWHERINFNGKNITVRSTNPDDPAVVAATVLDGDGGGSVVTFANGENTSAVLAGLTIRNGSGTFTGGGAVWGGGVFCDNASPTITGDVITGNTIVGDLILGWGGGIGIRAGAPVITHNTISNNSVNNVGGGIFYTASQVAPIITDNDITANQAPSGGGIGCEGFVSLIADNTVRDNTAEASGGGGGLRLLFTGIGGGITGNAFIDNDAGFGGGLLCTMLPTAGTLTVDGNRFQGNSAVVSGGGVYMDTLGSANGRFDLSHALLSGNTAAYGGAMYCDLGSSSVNVVLDGNTLSGNGASTSGGGVHAAPNGTGTCLITNSIIAGTTSGGGVYCGGPSAPTITYCNAWQNTGGDYVNGATAGTGCFAQDPLFASLAPGAEDFHLKSRVGRWNGTTWVADMVNSPCIDAGDPASSYEAETSYNGNRVNMGAYGNTVEASKTDPNHAPDSPTQVVIAPGKPKVGQDLTATAGGATDPDGHDVSYRYEWCCKPVGGDWGPWGDPGQTLPGTRTACGQQWKARALATDDPVLSSTATKPKERQQAKAASAWVESAPVTVGDTGPTPPALVRIVTRYPDCVTPTWAAAEGGTDVDGDDVSYRYQWCRSTDGGANWQGWECSGRLLRAERQRGEWWKVRARSVANGVATRWVESQPVEIVDAPPTAPATVTIDPANPVASDDIVATAEGATDPDGDAIRGYVTQWCRSTDGGTNWSDWLWTQRRAPRGVPAAGEWWKARARAISDHGGLRGPWLESQPVVISAAPRAVARATVTASARRAPSGVTQVTISLSAAATVRVEVVNLAGRVVAVLPEQALARGTQTLLWNGKSASGTQAPAGQYLVRVAAMTEGGGCSRALVPLHK